MPETLSKESFAEQLNTKFRVLLESGDAPEVELELAEVVEFPTLTHGRTDVERFSLFFYGPGDLFLPQQMYRLAHERMGELDIFLVPVAQEPRGYRYEAVFSYYK
jgi:L-ascorbate metabolism protein UlaG (beta-lactamase superfamily)